MRLRRHRLGLSLIEIVAAVGIILVLAALLLPAIGALRRRADVLASTQLVAAVHAAMQVYRGEDALRRFPPMAPDRTIRLGGTADLLAIRGLAVNSSVTGTIDVGAPALVDRWRQAVLYHLDDHVSGDGLAAMPRDVAGDPVRVPQDVEDWNPPRGSPARQTVPFAYVWSWGRPQPGHDRRDAARTWIYVRQTAETP